MSTITAQSKSQPSIDASISVPPGYKQAGVGVIPEDWNVLTLRDLCRDIVDGTHFTPRYVQDGIPFYSVENVTADNFTGVKLISNAEHNSLIQRCKPERGDILLTRIGSLGETKLIDWDVNASIYVSLALLKLGELADPGYIYCYSKCGQFVRDVESRSLVNATPQKINMGDIGAIPIPLPPTLTEQRAIAKALSDVDTLIGALSKLIAKKRAIKRAVMQQLLIGKTRLPGFSEEWEKKRIGDVLTCLSTADNPHADLSDDGDVEYIHYGDVHAHTAPILDCRNRSLPRITHKRIGNAAPLEDGDLVMVDASEDLEGVGKSFEVQGVAGRAIVAGLHTILCRGNPDDWAMGFKAYLQFIPAFKSALVRVATGISVYAISKKQLTDVELVLPSAPEQRAIVAVLSDMDAEIAALERRWDKTKQIKQGMMQQLLTGRIRLVKPEAKV